MTASEPATTLGSKKEVFASGPLLQLVQMSQMQTFEKINSMSDSLQNIEILNDLKDALNNNDIMNNPHTIDKRIDIYNKIFANTTNDDTKSDNYNYNYNTQFVRLNFN